MKAPFRNTPSPRLLCCLALTLIAFAIAFNLPATAQSGVTGAAFTTIPLDGSGKPVTPLSSYDPTLDHFDVNANTQYPDKTYVFLNGGPRNDNGAGLTPTAPSPGVPYYFQVTDPSGKVLLSADPAACRIVDVVTDSGGHGRVDGLDASVVSNSSCPTRLVFADPTRGNTDNPVQLCPAASGRTDTLSNGAPLFDANNWCDTTPNNGGVYKAYLIRADSASTTDPSGVGPNDGIHLYFSNKDSQTDNFKIKQQGSTCTTDCNTPPPASLSVCKFWDLNADHLEDNGEPLLPGWTINITNVDGNNHPGTAVTGSDTSNFGCVMFSIGFADGSTSTQVTLSEDLSKAPTPNWNQTAPPDGTYSVSDGLGGSVSVSVSGFVQSLTVAPGDAIQLNDFGNTGFDLTVSKTANPSFTRTYNWNITKCAEDPNSTNCVSNPPKVDQAGGTVTFNYQVAVSETGFIDSAWQVKGAITVTNPNSFAVDNVTITENGDGVGTCTMDDTSTATETVTIAAGGSTSKNYTCTYTSNPGSKTNSASASWDATLYNTPDGSATATKDYAFGDPTNPVNKTITVTDCFNGTLSTTGTCSGSSTTLGTLTATDTTPYTSHTYSYSHTITVPKFGCATFPNTARIVETDQRVSASVEACGPEKTGALTMGYWQNKNGQGIISGANQTILGTWLRAYHPFSDAPSAGLATYVLNIIKAASCTSTSKTCNSMLRGQMLATALDVYFSDPALGGNKIGAPTPIGGDLIDLTQICKMIDGSGGTATCSGTYENVSSAFGGATSMTVLQMLAYQNTADPAADAGAVWYGQVKATQVLAKDAFDAINNQVAFAP